MAEPTPCPKCENPKRQLLKDRGMVWCGKCGFMEEDESSYEYQAASCIKCGRVPRARMIHDMPDENTLDDSLMKWQCCGASYPVWPSEVKFWCHVYLAQERGKNE